MSAKKPREIFAGRLMILIWGLPLILFSCGHKTIPNPTGPAQIKGLVYYQGRPAADVQVYVYQAVNGDSSADRRQIERLLRSQETETEKKEATEQAAEISDREEKELDDYPEYRGPADYKSAPTGADGQYSVSVAAGRYVLAARKHADPKIQVGPLTPQDFSSLVSKPLTVEVNKVYAQDFLLERLLEQNIDFNTRYAIKTRETEMRGTIVDDKSQPLTRFYVTAKHNLKVSNRPDFISDPSDNQGRYSLYLPGEGIYYLELRRSPLGELLPVRFNSKFINVTDNSVEILEGEVIDGVQIIFSSPINSEMNSEPNNDRE
ncbi:MAG: hypothetical protein HZA78_13090 [Candidatus Schekmanbacteria bacterium]|nr:hypothetical protein [Candidatus Schekmanbacteria bacterium]